MFRNASEDMLRRCGSECTLRLRWTGMGTGLGKDNNRKEDVVRRAIRVRDRIGGK